MGGITIVVCALLGFVFIGVPIITLIADLLGSSPEGREAQITRRVADAHTEIVDAFAVARDKMTRRAGLDDSFRLGRFRRGDW
jgi:hypothetical protein